VETQDETGEPIVTWRTFLVAEPAEFLSTKGFEQMRGMQLEAGTQGVFRVRYREGYTEQMKIVHLGQDYGIQYLNPVDGRQRFIDIMVAS
jgi:SPP1 family predicted phage head-tail adaptor